MIFFSDRFYLIIELLSIRYNVLVGRVIEMKEELVLFLKYLYVWIVRRVL